MERFYKFISRVIGTIHLILYALNIASVVMLIVKTPWYVYIPMLTLLSSPLLGGIYCIFNQLENHFRAKAGLPLIHDRFSDLFIRGNK